ncbi:MAG: hypothetical protein SXU28_12915, partial [Pseudomonadota bacterium]|nr:hypothetical protein [Pseudomonadota bacterium]
MEKTGVCRGGGSCSGADRMRWRREQFAPAIGAGHRQSATRAATSAASTDWQSLLCALCVRLRCGLRDNLLNLRDAQRFLSGHRE